MADAVLQHPADPEELTADTWSTCCAHGSGWPSRRWSTPKKGLAKLFSKS